MKIFAAALVTETNTFSPIPTGLSDFDIFRCQADKNGRYDFPEEESLFGLWQDMAIKQGDEFYFGLSTMACPAGYTTHQAYKALCDELLNAVQACGSVDIVLLYLHGAMVAQDCEDCEGDLLSKLRNAVGPKTIIAAELDLHCHLTQLMASSADLLISFKEFPHTDVLARAEELFELAHGAAVGRYRPTTAVFDCKMVGMYPTSTPVMRGYVDEMIAAEQQAGVLSVSFIHGFPFGDVAEAGGKLLVIADNNQALAEAMAEKLGNKILALRQQIAFQPLTLNEALETACDQLAALPADGIKPIVVADQSDNPGAGAPADATFALKWLLDHKVTQVGMAIFWDPQVVKLAIAAGEGSTIAIRFGGKMGVASGDPLDLTVTVKAIRRNHKHSFPQETGEPALYPLGDTVALACGGIHVIVSTERCQCFSPSIFDELGVPSQRSQLLIVKSTQHFYSAFAEIAQSIIYMAAPGAVPPIVQNIPYQRMATADKYPWIATPVGKLV